MTAAAALDDRSFWLPPSLETKPATNFGAGGLWKDEARMTEEEFRFDFGMLKTEIYSPVESDESEEDEFFARLTQRLSLSESRNISPVDFHIQNQKSPESLKVFGGSPQSTLGGIRSWSGPSSNESNHNSPPATPFESHDDSLGLIHAAAGHVARMNRNIEVSLQASINGQWRAAAKLNPRQNPSTGFYADLLSEQKYIAAARQAGRAALWDHYSQIMKSSDIPHNSGYGASSEGLTQSSRPPLQHARVVVKPNFQAVPLQRKESAGTGVFIPRSYDSNSSVPPRKRTVAPCALVPAKVVLALNSSIEKMSSPRSNCQPIHSSASLSQQSYDSLMARRRALLDQQQRSMAMRTENISNRSPESCLPQEWSY